MIRRKNRFGTHIKLGITRLNVKFGRMMQSIGNADEITGLNDKETGFVVRLSKKDKRAAQKKAKQVTTRRKKNNKRNN